jgi:HD-like signal output (HDOD) protein/ActR/RegA family two-component response regulator
MNRTLYVVDDQAPVMETAVLVLKRTDKSWTVTGYNDPLSALEAVKANLPDLVLSDQLMPGMQGSELLEQVRNLSPKTIRIIMSGYVSLSALELITSAHQYIAKPFEPSLLREMVKRSFAAQERIINAGLQTLVTGLRSIPSLPQVHHSLLKELEDDRTASAAIANIVSNDPGLSIKVLQLANSPLFGRGTLVTNPVDAVMCLGTDMISAIVLSQSLFKHYEALKGPELDIPKVWTHSWETARLAQHLCRERRLGSEAGEEAFLAGLLHEIGRFLIIDNFPEAFKAACDAARKNRVPLVTGLRETLQATPSQVGAYVLELWGLPGAVVDAIGALDNPGQDPTEEFSVRAALYIADHIAHGKFPPDPFRAEDWNMNYLKSVGCEDDLREWEQFFTKKNT